MGKMFLQAMGPILTQDPATNQIWARIPAATAQDVDRAVEAAHSALEGPWAL